MIHCKKVRNTRRRGEPASFHFTATLSAQGSALLSARGQTREEAIAMLEKRIHACLTGEWYPVLLFYRDYGTLLYRASDAQWIEQHFTIDPRTGVRLCGSSSGPESISCARAERAARMHLAHSQWDQEEEESAILLYPEDQREFATWARTQKRQIRQARLLREHGWSPEEIASLLGGLFYGISSERLEALGDPRSLLTQVAQEMSKEQNAPDAP